MSFEARLSELFGIAVSRFGLSWDEFLELSPIEFHWALKDSNMREFNLQRSIFEAMRIQTVHLMNISGKSLKREITNPQQWMPFVWEKTTKSVKKQSVEEMKEILLSIISGVKRKNERLRRLKKSAPPIKQQKKRKN